MVPKIFATISALTAIFIGLIIFPVTVHAQAGRSITIIPPKFELFGNAARSQRMHPARQSAASEIARCELTVLLDGRSRQLTLEKNQTNLLDAALQQGLELPYACKSGICSTCRAMLVEGKVEMDNPFALTEEDITRGYILCCQSFPLSDKLVVDFDQ